MQRRLASSTRAIRLTLERRVDRIEKALEDAAAYLREPEGVPASMFPDEEEARTSTRRTAGGWRREAFEEWLPDTEEAFALSWRSSQRLLALAEEVEQAGRAQADRAARRGPNLRGSKEDRRSSCSIFTEHRDTLDYLVENLSKDFEVAQIHGR